MKIVLDANGGDNAPSEIVKGAALAINSTPDIEVVLYGEKSGIEESLKGLSFDRSRMEIVYTTEIITNDDVPTVAIRRKTDSSLVKALERVKEDDECKGFVSAGSTGAVLTGSVLKIGRIKGVQRPALAPLLPTVTGGKVLLVDCGANSECKPNMLLQFAYMGDAYMRALFGMKNPRIALLSNGTEDKKGNDLTHETFPLLKESGLNFVGNMEARDMLSGNYDVIVSDGFSGNVALKGCEGTAGAVFSVLKQEIKNGGLRAKLGYLLLKKAFRNLKHTMDYSESGGAVFVGAAKPVVKSHGSSKAKSICASLIQVRDMVNNDFVNKIKENLPSND